MQDARRILTGTQRTCSGRVKFLCANSFSPSASFGRSCVSGVLPRITGPKSAASHGACRPPSVHGGTSQRLFGAALGLDVPCILCQVVDYQVCRRKNKLVMATILVFGKLTQIFSSPILAESTEPKPRCCNGPRQRVVGACPVLCSLPTHHSWQVMPLFLGVILHLWSFFHHPLVGEDTIWRMVSAQLFAWVPAYR